MAKTAQCNKTSKVAAPSPTFTLGNLKRSLPSQRNVSVAAQRRDKPESMARALSGDMVSPKIGVFKRFLAEASTEKPTPLPLNFYPFI